MDNNKNKKSNWLKDALYRKTNKKWLNYSSQIARRILAKIEENNLSQADLARALDVSPQQISKIVKGKENLTLETIAKISSAIGTELIQFPIYSYSQSTAVLQFQSVSFTTISFDTPDNIGDMKWPQLNEKEPVSVTPKAIEVSKDEGITFTAMKKDENGNDYSKQYKMCA